MFAFINPTNPLSEKKKTRAGTAAKCCMHINKFVLTIYHVT